MTMEKHTHLKMHFLLKLVIVYCYVMSVSLLEGKSTWEYHLQLFGGCPEFDPNVQW